jgi:hypothetical protein
MLRKLYFSVRMHWRLYLTIVILGSLCYYLFVKNYCLRLPYESKHIQSYESLVDSLAGCESAQLIDAHEQSMLDNNPDLK